MVVGFGEEDHRSKLPFSSHHIKDTCYQHDLPLMILTLITWLMYYLSGFVHYKAILSPFGTVLIERKSLEVIFSLIFFNFLFFSSLIFVFGNFQTYKNMQNSIGNLYILSTKFQHITSCSFLFIDIDIASSLSVC